MVCVWVYPVLSVLLVCLFSLVGVLALPLKSESGKDELMGLVAFSVGGLLGGAFLHLIPESYGEFPPGSVSLNLPLGDFGVLLYAWFKPKKALLLNLASALTAVLGALVALYLGDYAEDLTSFLLPFAAGNFVYIAGSDPGPELKDQKEMMKGLSQFGLIGLGVLLMYFIKILH